MERMTLADEVSIHGSCPGGGRCVRLGSGSADADERFRVAKVADARATAGAFRL